MTQTPVQILRATPATVLVLKLMSVRLSRSEAWVRGGEDARDEGRNLVSPSSPAATTWSLLAAIRSAQETLRLPVEEYGRTRALLERIVDLDLETWEWEVEHAQVVTLLRRATQMAEEWVSRQRDQTPVSSQQGVDS